MLRTFVLYLSLIQRHLEGPRARFACDFTELVMLHRSCAFKAAACSASAWASEDWHEIEHFAPSAA